TRTFPVSNTAAKRRVDVQSKRLKSRLGRTRVQRKPTERDYATSKGALIYMI
ncbi:hypothetical protein J6590_089407, partial [Homalodisca vitripennis]